MEYVNFGFAWSFLHSEILNSGCFKTQLLNSTACVPPTFFTERSGSVER